jgi:VWFA-related protein
VKIVVPALAAALALSGQQPPFKSGTDLVVVDVHVVDKSGKPIVDLRPEDFEVSITSRQRRVVSAELVSYATPLAGAAAGSRDAAPGGTRPRRMFILAVDEHSLRPANARAAAHAAERFIARLQPDDLVGVYAYPTGAARHDLTADHDAAIRTLGSITGLFEEPASRFHMTPSEIIDCASGDMEVARRVQQRECRNGGCSARDIQQEAIGLATILEARVTQSLRSLQGLVAGLATIPGRKILVLVSGGLIATDRATGRANARADFVTLGRQAAMANLAVFALHLDWSFFQALSSRGGLRPSYFRDANMAASGLEMAAGAAGGAVMRVHGTSPDVAFDRVLRETSAHYLLGVEATDADRDGRPHLITVKTKRRGTQVRSRKELTIPAR